MKVQILLGQFESHLVRNVKKTADGWLDRKGIFYPCKSHIEWATEDLRLENEELFRKYREWFLTKAASETAIDFLMKECGWWKKSSIDNNKLWLGERPASPTQRRYINKDLGERQTNDYFEKGYEKTIMRKPL